MQKYNLNLIHFNKVNVPHLIVSQHNSISNITDIPSINKLDMNLKFNLDVKHLKKISYDMFLIYMFFFSLTAMQKPKFFRVVKGKKIVVTGLKTSFTSQSIYYFLNYFIILILAQTNIENAFIFKNINNFSNLFLLKKVNPFLYTEQFEYLANFLKRSKNFLNISFDINYNQPSLPITSKHNNYLKLLQLPYLQTN